MSDSIKNLTLPRKRYQVKLAQYGFFQFKLVYFAIYVHIYIYTVYTIHMDVNMNTIRFSIQEQLVAYVRKFSTLPHILFSSTICMFC